MNEYKFQMRRKKRGQHCLTGPSYLTFSEWVPGEDGRLHGKGPMVKCYGGGLCGCGCRTPPSKRNKTRIVKRKLASDLRKQLSSGD